MSVPRPVIIAVVGVALIAGVFVLMRGQSSTGTVTPAPTVQPRTAPVHAKPVTRPVAPVHTPAKPAKPQPAAKPAATPSAPAAIQPVVDALGKGRVVVLLFTQPGSADDDSTRTAVASVAGMSGVSVFTADLGQLSAYRPLLSGVAVSQVPAVVVARAGAKARLVEGFVDPGTLRQTVADEHR